MQEIQQANRFIVFTAKVLKDNAIFFLKKINNKSTIETKMPCQPKERESQKDFC